MIRTCRLSAVGLLLCAVSLAAAQDEKKEEKPKLSKDEQLVLDLTNEARAKMKLPPFKVNALLGQAALVHNQNMAKQKKVEHILDGKSPADRADAVKYDWASVNENLAWVDKNSRIKEMFEGWMKSKVHRENILGDFEEIGVSVHEDKIKGGMGGFFFTQVFGTQRKKP